MKQFLKKIKERAAADPKRIIFAEGDEERVRDAAKQIEAEGVAIPVLLKNPIDEPKRHAYAERYAELREVSVDEALEAMEDPHVFATMMLLEGEGDAMISGPTASSRERILPAFRLIKTRSKEHKASGFFFMVLPDRVDEDAANGGILLFADCAVNIDPTAEELAQIAEDSAKTAKIFDLDPKVAFLSFSTKGSGEHSSVDKVRKAVELFKAKNPDIPADGEFQVDAALMDEIGARKAPGSPVAGLANVLIFPDLNAGNIAYKLVERLAGAEAIGPIVQGLNKPVNELSRGCDAEDIVNLAALTTIEAQHFTQ